MKEPYVPQASYPCHYCQDECSWRAEDLYWSSDLGDWVCTGCESDTSLRGVCLAELVGNLADTRKALTWAKNLLDVYDERFAHIAELERELAEAKADMETLCYAASCQSAQVKRLVELGQAMQERLQIAMKSCHKPDCTWCVANRKLFGTWDAYLAANNLQPEGE